MTGIRPLIMCGGNGTRLWPVSRASLPKQFAILVGERSTFQQTMMRAVQLGATQRPLVVTNALHRYLVEEQLAEIGVQADILIEPERRDSGPAILAGACEIAREDADTLVLVLASDQMVQDEGAFREAVVAGIDPALSDHLVTFGVTPTHPATAYGYIQPGEAVGEGAWRVSRFAEKPGAERAASYLLDGFLWNSGNFLFRAGALIGEYERHDPQTAAAVEAAVAQARRDVGTVCLDAEAFARARRLSVDYAVFEHTERAAVVPMSCGWSDVGNWEALWALGEGDPDDNVVRGEVEMHDARGCYVSSDGPLTSVLGLSDIVVVASTDSILVADRRRAGEVKEIVASLQSRGRPEAETHPRVHRPWGWYEVLDAGSRFQVKRIVVRPSGRLSLQKHRHRAEHWVVVTGRARVTIGDEVQELGPNQHAHIPLGAVHRLENFGNTPVEIIEVQHGEYLGEDDIVRIEDIYART
ncbi:mannose-1-phosphate guanylyltransferase/mannose-6-phosphate isomerase [Methylobacterium nodulans]|uniref:mannose-1-phosphate guanylyltransferase n=1 Tax=Methylobacterium nodulans (strain LMG 21967 / CNCM I-2342 / ORS 2060) TaxID=460265 RepID=B8IQD8_METNO|nr:mannose-1-phosphate guanylyltransferase/mannose-6-phosphate isomerase [Methylobacterium nodulans]ACL60450.1 mannose-1-phosphate guanylyltransferase/mannose-6-phosphate isomerase [Methylobacterium nodulans ORS 2060]